MYSFLLFDLFLAMVRVIRLYRGTYLSVVAVLNDPTVLSVFVYFKLLL